MQVITGIVHAEQVDSQGFEDFCQLTGPFPIAAVTNGDNCRSGIQPDKTAAFHQSGTVDGMQDGYPKVGEGAGEGQLLTTAVADSHTTDYSTPFNDYGRITGED